MEVVLVTYRNKNPFLAIQIAEFRDTPIVCKKNAQNKELEEGTFYIRPLGVARTTRVPRAEDMQDLLDFASEKKLRKMFENYRRIDLMGNHSDSHRFLKELKDIEIDPSGLTVKIIKAPHWKVNIRPLKYNAELFPTLGELYKIIEQNKVRFRGSDYPHLSHRDKQRTQGINWISS
jgi:hypothetical protein